MLELVPEKLWIANALEARDPKVLFDSDIQAVVDVAYEERPALLPRQLIYCRHPLNDGGGNSSASLRLAILTVTELVRAGIVTVVACSAGMSRSPLIAAFAVANLEGCRPQEVLERIGSSRPLQLNASLWNDAVATFGSE